MEARRYDPVIVHFTLINFQKPYKITLMSTLKLALLTLILVILMAIDPTMTTNSSLSAVSGLRCVHINNSLLF